MKVKSIFLWTVISLSAFLISACGDPNPRENVDSTISEAIFLLEKRDVENLIKNYIPPKNLEKMLKKQTKHGVLLNSEIKLEIREIGI